MDRRDFMVTFLLMISFLLHLLGLIAIYQLFQQIQTYKQAKTTDNSEEVAALFEAYLEDIKAENNRLQKEIIEKQILSTAETSNMIAPIMEDKHTATDSISEETPYFDINDSIETSLQAKILQLSHQGYNAEAIAKRLNCGKTEAALMIKLQKKNDRKA